MPNANNVVMVLDDDIVKAELRRRGVLAMLNPDGGRDTAIYWEEKDLSIFIYSNMPGDSGYIWVRYPNKTMFDEKLKDLINSGERMIFFNIIGRR